MTINLETIDVRSAALATAKQLDRPFGLDDVVKANPGLVDYYGSQGRVRTYLARSLNSLAKSGELALVEEGLYMDSQKYFNKQLFSDAEVENPVPQPRAELATIEPPREGEQEEEVIPITSIRKQVYNRLHEVLEVLDDYGMTFEFVQHSKGFQLSGEWPQ